MVATMAFVSNDFGLASKRGAPRDSLSRIVLEACVAQDASGFRQFVERFQRPIIAYLARMLSSQAPIEDLAQDVFLKAYRGFPAFDPATNIVTWIFTIATRVALDERKRRRISSVSIDDAAAQAGSDRWKRWELQQAIEQAAETLSDDQRAAFVLAEFHNVSMEEIAMVLGVPENTVKTRIFRAKERLREALAEYREERP